jgi:CHASE3 domain sensor protein
MIKELDCILTPTEHILSRRKRITTIQLLVNNNPVLTYAELDVNKKTVEKFIDFVAKTTPYNQEKYFQSIKSLIRGNQNNC